MKKRRIKEIFQVIKTGRTPDTTKKEFYEPEELLWIGPADLSKCFLIQDSIKKVSMFANQKNEVSVFKGEALLITTIGASIGNVSYIPEGIEFSTNQQVTTLLSLIHQHNYLKYVLLNNKNLIKSVNLSNTIEQINNNRLREILLDINEDNILQKKISNFLDKKTSLIDKKISLLEKKIELYEEYKRNILINIFIDSNQSKKFKKLGVIFECKMGKPISGEFRTGTKYPYYGSNGASGDFIDEYLFDGKYVVTAQDGSIGSTHIFEGKFYPSNHTHVISSRNEQNLVEFLYFYLKGYDLKFLSTGSVIPKLTQKNLKNIEVPFLTLEEQSKVVSTLNKIIFKIDKLIELTKKEIELQKEYKKTLINDVVTGKIEV